MIISSTCYFIRKKVLILTEDSLHADLILKLKLLNPMKKYTAFFLAFFSAITINFGQNCNNGSTWTPPGCLWKCSELPYDSLGFPGGSNGFTSQCPDLILRKWYQVNPNNTNIKITSTENDCPVGNSLYVEVFDSNFESISPCKEFNEANIGDFFSILNVFPSESYSISLAKNDRISCNYNLRIENIENLPSLSLITPDIQVANWSGFYEGELFLPSVANATNYEWEVTNTGQIPALQIATGNGTRRITYTRANDTPLPSQICVTPESGCDTGQKKCITLDNFSDCPIGSNELPGCLSECPFLNVEGSRLDSANYRGVLPDCGNNLQFTYWVALEAREDTIRVNQIEYFEGAFSIQIFDKNLIPVSNCEIFEGSPDASIKTSTALTIGDTYSMCIATNVAGQDDSFLSMSIEGHNSFPTSIPEIAFDSSSGFLNGTAYIDLGNYQFDSIFWEGNGLIEISDGQGTNQINYINPGAVGNTVCYTGFSSHCGMLKKICKSLLNYSPSAPCTPTAGGLPAGDNPPGCSLCGPIYQGSTAGYTPTAPGNDGFPCGTIENNQFISIIADSSGKLSATILASDCVNGQGVQLVIYDQFFNPVSNCFSSSGRNSPGNVTASGLTPGETYWIMIDGFAGDICDILITTSGGINAGPPDPPGPFTISPDTSPLCPGAIVTYSIDSVRGATNYEWIIPGNATILSGGGVTDLFVELEYIAGGGVVRVTPNNPCFPGIPAIEPVVVLPILPTLKPPEFICVADFPIVRDGNIFSSSGSYEVTYQTGLGCDSIVTYVFITSIQIPNVIDTTICAGESITVGGILYNTSINQTITLSPDYPQANGCDSIVVLKLNALDPIAEIAPPGALGCTFGQNVFLDGTASSAGTDITYEWQSVTVGVIEGATDQATAEISEAGIFVLTVTETDSSGMFCIARDTVEVVYQQTLPDPVFSLNTGPFCPGTTNSISVMPVPSAYPDGYVWTMPQGGGTFIGGADFSDVEFDLPAQNNSGGTICVTASGDCGTSQQTCIPFDIVPIPTSDFDVNPQICVGEPTQVIYTGNASSSAVYNWDFSGGTAVSGANTANPVIEFDSPGAYEIILSVSEFGCNSTQTVNVVAVNAQLADPIISCNSTLSSVTFEWIPIFGASGYDVNVISGQTGQLSGTEYFISGLSPNEEVIIEVTAQSLAGCTAAMSRAICVAQDCPFLPLSIDAVADICLAQNAQPIQLASSGAGQSGTYQWFGNGVSSDGIFDPSVAGIGTHQIEVTYQEASCDYSAQIMITVDGQTSPPVITCTPDLDNVLFDWNANPEINSYDIEVDGVSMGNMTSTSFLVENLAPMQQVQITVIGMTDTSCGAVTSTLACSATACPPSPVDIINVPQVICEGETPSTPASTIQPVGVTFDFCNWSGTGIDSDGNWMTDSLPPGIYTVSVNCMAGNCSYTNSLDYEITSKPDLTADILSPIWYPGLVGSIDLSVQNGVAPYSFDWSNGATTEDLNGGTRGTRYCVTVTDSEGCSEVDCYAIGEGIFRINPLHTICAGTGKTISVRPGRGANFSWSPSTGLSCDDCPNPLVNPSSSTIYTITATMADGRMASTNILTIVVPTLFCNSLTSDEDARQLFENLDFDTEEIELENLMKIKEETDELLHTQSVKISPNPTTGFVNISSLYPIENVEVFDFSGRKLFDKKAAEIDLSDLAKGVYFLKIKINGRTEVKRVVLI